MDQIGFDKSFFQNNRRRFEAQMSDNSIALWAGNRMQFSNADDAMGFVQNNDLFYLTGIEQEETLLLLYPQAYREENRELLFLKKPDPVSSQWDGERLSKEEARDISGVARIEWTEDFEKILQSMAFEAEAFYLGHNEHVKRQSADRRTPQDDLIHWIKEKYPLHPLKRGAKITRGLRQIKSEVELNAIKRANAIAAECFERLLKAVKPGQTEKAMEAILTYEMTLRGARGHAFQPIVASGKNSCVLHYNKNDQPLEEGDFLLLDFGVNFQAYNSDTTRCLPVSGKFSARQLEVYKAVQYCLEEGSQLLQIGKDHQTYEKQMARLVEEQLIKLGLLSKAEVEKQDPRQPLYRRYFMHGTAHHLGLDVHDVGLYSRKLQEGMVLTCEPGVYIPEEGIGCRLENDYYLDQSGPVNLSVDLPLDPQEIEARMQA